MEPIGGDEYPGLVDERNVRVTARRETGVFVAFDDENVVLARAQGRHSGCLFSFLNAQVDSRQCVQDVGERWDEGGPANGQERPDGDRSRDLSRQWSQGLEGFLDVGVDTFSCLGDDGAGGGQDGTGSGAFDQLQADFFFEFLDLL